MRRTKKLWDRLVGIVEPELLPKSTGHWAANHAVRCNVLSFSPDRELVDIEDGVFGLKVVSARHEVRWSPAAVI